MDENMMPQMPMMNMSGPDEMEHKAETPETPATRLGAFVESINIAEKLSEEELKKRILE